MDTANEDDVRRVAREIFLPEKLNLAMVGPMTKIKPIEI
jgi:hypothetical protein